MKRSLTLRACLSVVVTLGIFTPVLMLVDWPRIDPPLPTQPPAGTWPMLGGTVGRNGVNTLDRNIPYQWTVPARTRKPIATPPPRNIKWVAPLGTRAYGGPAIANGKIYIGTNNGNPRDPAVKGDKCILMCFRESDGRFLWQIVHDKLPSGQANDWPQEGLCSTPVVEGNRLWYVSNRCEVICADADEGKIIWRLDMLKDLGVYPHNMSCGSPLILGDTVFVTTSNGVDESHISIPAPQAPSFVAVDKRSGQVKWQNNLPTAQAVDLPPVRNFANFAGSRLKQLMDRGQVVMHGQWSSPAAGRARGRLQVIFPAGDGWLYSFAAESGELLWKFDANPTGYTYELGGRGKRSDFMASPVIVGERLYIGTGQDPEHYEGVGHLWCIDITGRGDVSPEYASASGSPTQPTLRGTGNSAAVWHYGGPTNAADRARLQRDYRFGRTMSNVAVHDGLVYAGELSGYLHCLDAETGKPYWMHDLRSAVWGSPYWVDGKVFIATDDGDVWVFRHGKDHQLLSRVEMGEALQVNAIVAANGVLYLKSQSQLIAVASP